LNNYFQLLIVPISGEEGQNNEQVGAPSKERFTKNVSDVTVRTLLVFNFYKLHFFQERFN